MALEEGAWYLTKNWAATTKGYGWIYQQALWGTSQQHYTQAKAQRLQCKDPQVMKKYNKYLQAHLQKKQIFNRVITLAKQITETILAKQEHKFEKLNNKITEGKIKAEIQCRKIKAVKYGWMSELNKAIQTVLYWKDIDKRQKRGRIRKDILAQ